MIQSNLFNIIQICPRGSSETEDSRRVRYKTVSNMFSIILKSNLEEGLGIEIRFAAVTNKMRKQIKQPPLPCVKPDNRIFLYQTEPFFWKWSVNFSINLERASEWTACGNEWKVQERNYSAFFFLSFFFKTLTLIKN